LPASLVGRVRGRALPARARPARGARAGGPGPRARARDARARPRAREAAGRGGVRREAPGPPLSEPPRSALLRALELARAHLERRAPKEVLEAILDSAIELTGAERGFVVEPADQGELCVVAARNYGRRGVSEAE